MGYVDDILDEFDGQLSKDDIYHSTYKEIIYLRKHRKELKRRKGFNNKHKHPTGNDIDNIL